MINIGPNLPVVTPTQSSEARRAEKTSETQATESATETVRRPWVERRRQDRRRGRRGQKPWLELRSGRDRRRNSATGATPSIDIKA
ncbi:MAG: hypothetical protein P8Y42_01140 [Exilibacterium sp.]